MVNIHIGLENYNAAVETGLRFFVALFNIHKCFRLSPDYS